MIFELKECALNFSCAETILRDGLELSWVNGQIIVSWFCGEKCALENGLPDDDAS